MRYRVRNIYIDGQKHEVYFGISKKRYNTITIYVISYFLEDPRERKTKPIKIKEGFKSEEEAIKFGKIYMKNMYKGMLDREKEN